MDNDPVIIKKRRAIVKSACTRIKTYVTSISSMSPALIPHIEERKTKLDQHWEEYNDHQTKLEILDSSEANDSCFRGGLL